MRCICFCRINEHLFNTANILRTFVRNSTKSSDRTGNASLSSFVLCSGCTAIVCYALILSRHNLYYGDNVQ
ncbi:hypothetical protein DUM78_09790 [Shigella flexneri]|nr:hypothetical protein [Shigella flexneri]EGD4736178.1 hypothetical protein [Shigella flexneri]EGD4864445.1 hypothetical protein [Shigella flexneri]EGD7393198.1 hypothetical protein [Shigella flexneri]EGD7585087.1 hypothetical protein [Shigella flexneri]